MTEDTRHGRAGSTTDTPVALSALSAELIADLPNHSAGRTARTVVTGTTIRAVVIALRAGAELSEHDSPSAATLFVITGDVTLQAGDREWPVHAGQLVQIPPQRHAVLAHTDAAFLLTVALH